MNANLLTPSPYLRDRLAAAVDGLKDDAETARNRLEAATQDVAEALDLLADAQGAQQRAQAEVDGIAKGLAWAEAEVARLTALIDADPDETIAELGLMPEEPPVAEPDPCSWCALPQRRDDTGALVHTHSGAAQCDDDLTAPGVGDVRAQVAPFLPVTPSVPRGPAGVLAATGGPGVTVPDTGLAPERLEPPPGHGVHSHARPDDGWVSRVTGGWPVLGRRKKNDEQDGDA